MTTTERTSDITAPTREQVAAVEAGAYAALDAIGIDLENRVITIGGWTNEHGANAVPDLRGGTLTVQYFIKSEA